MTGLAGCTVGLDQNPSFTKLTKKVQALESAKLSESISDVRQELKVVMQDVATIQTNLQNAPDGSAQMQKKLAELSDRIAKLEERLKTGKPAPAAAEKVEAAPAPAAEGEKVQAAPAPKARGKAAKPAAAKAAKRPSAKAASRGAGRVSTPQGFYYTVKSGDTLADVAQAHGLSSAALARANHLPLSAPLLAGQAIYIPK